MNEKRKLSNGTIFGYGLGAFSDAAANNFFLLYMLYFFTTVVGMSAGKSGAIISITTVVAAVVAIFIGPASDRTRAKKGTRRIYLVIGALMLLVGLSLVFRPMLGLGDTGKFCYYIVFFMLTYLGYVVFLVPYNAMGAELTDDYDERTKLRTPATIMNYVGNIIGISLPMAGVAFFMKHVETEGAAWNIYAIIVAAACFVAVMISWITTKGKELKVETEVVAENANIFKEFWRIIKLKPFRWIIGIVASFGVGYTVFSSGLTYYVLYYAGLTEVQMSTATLLWIFIGMGLTVIMSFLATKTSKKTAIAIGFLLSAACVAIFWVCGVHSFGMLVLMLTVFGFGNSSFWLLIYPIVYDIVELYEYKYGERKEGAMLSLYGCIFTLSTALGTQVLTIAMTIAGYDSSLAVQSADTINGIAAIVLGIPVIAFVICGILCVTYPLTKGAFEKLMVQLEHKRKGEPTDETGIERIV